MATESSFDDLLTRLRAGDERAAAQIYQRFAGRLIGQAKKSLPRGLRPKEDPEDVLQSVLATFFKRVNRGEFQFDGWDHLEALLVRITVRKCARHVERYGARRRDARREVCAAGQRANSGDDDDRHSDFEGLAREPTPEEAAVLVETIERLLAGLTDERHRRMLVMRLEGHSIAEICADVGRSERLVHRVLEEVRKRLRKWSEQEG